MLFSSFRFKPCPPWSRPLNTVARIAAITLVVLAAGIPARAADRAAPEPVTWEKSVGGVAWLTNYNLALEKALLNRRPILVTFYTDWCGWCRKLEGTTFPDPRFAGLMRFVVPVRLNGDREKGLTAMLRVTSYPTSVLLSRNGREIGRVVGYQPPDVYAAALSSLLAAREPMDEAAAAAAAHPADAEALYTFADVLLAVGRYEDARQVLARVAALSDTRARELAGDVALDGALTHLFAHEYAAALPGFEDYIARFPKGDRSDQALFFYGTALIGAGKRSEGVARLREAAQTTSSEYLKLESDRLVRMTQEEPARGQR